MSQNNPAEPAREHRLGDWSYAQYYKEHYPESEEILEFADKEIDGKVVHFLRVYYPAHNIWSLRYWSGTEHFDSEESTTNLVLSPDLTPLRFYSRTEVNLFIERLAKNNLCWY